MEIIITRKMINKVSPEFFAPVLVENQPGGDIQTWMTDLITKNWEMVVAGGLFFVLIGTDVVAISRDVLADGKVDLRDKEDLLALGRGTVRIVSSFVGAVALKYALEKNPTATLATLAAGVVAGVGITKTIELAKGITRGGNKKDRLLALGGATAFAVATGAAVGALELGALQIDSEAWLIANAGMALVAATRPKDTMAMIDSTRNFLSQSK